MKKPFSFNFFDWLLVGGVIVTSIVMAVLNGHMDWLDFIGVVTGIFNLVLCAKGNTINYLFGIIYNVIYAYIAFSTKLYADATIYAVYYLPMQFIGWANWKKNQNADSLTVQPSHLSLKSALWMVAAAAVLVPVLAKVLSLPVIGDAQPWVDSATTAASIIGMYMMVKALSEQWYIWAVLDVLLVVKWINETMAGTPHAAMWLVMFSFYLANSIYGLIQWNRMAKAKKEESL